MAKIKCLVCGKEFNSQEDFEFHILLPEIEKRERERKEKCGGWGYSDSDIEEKHLEAVKKSLEEGWEKIQHPNYDARCQLCGGEIEADYWVSNWSGEGWTIKCSNCGILFDED
jgi:ribosomal protein S27E